MSRKHTGVRLAAQLIVLLLTVLFFTSPVWAQNLEINVETSRGGELSGVKVYAFTESGSYTGKNATTDGSGTALFDLEDFEEGTYKFRVDYLGSKFWSQVITISGTVVVEVVIEEETVEVTVTTGSGPVEGVRVYLFSESGSYLGIYEVTDAEGVVYFDLPVGKAFKFRADILGGQYWSDVITVSGGGMNNVSVNAGGGFLQVTVEKASGSPMEGTKVYLFSQSGSYLGLYEVTDASDLVGFDVPQGTFKVRADYLGYQFWSAEAIVTGDTAIVLTIPHQPVEVTVQGVFQGVPEPIEGIKVYLFSSAGSYLGQYQQTNSSGKVTFDLPEKVYKVRVDYLGQQFWSEEFAWQDTVVNVPMADAEITVTGAGLPQEGVKVYVFSAAGSYLGLYDTTNNDGKVTFRIPEGAYKFRADEGGGQYWSAVIDIVAGQVNSVAIEIDVSPVTVSISAGPETILQGESSTLTWSSTDADSCVIEPGIGSVDMTGSISVSPTETTTYTITVTGPGGTASATVTVTVTYPAPSVGISADPETILLGETSTLNWSSAEADSCVIEPGIGSVDVTGSISISPTGTTTYTITATGPGGSATATVTVMVTYPQPTVSISANPGTILQGESSILTWTFTGADSATIDQGIGTVEPSGSTTVSPTETTTYTITVTGPGGTATASVTITVTSPTSTVTISADPGTIQPGRSSTLTWTSTNADTCMIDPDIGSVDVNGSTTVSPTQTTTYTITATGPGGTATDTITVTVNYPPSITVVEPDGVDDTADTSFTIQWSDADPDDDATISLYYDTDNSGEDGTLIVSGLSEDLDGAGYDAYVWDTTEVAEGTYYVYAIIDDGLNDPVVYYSDGVVTIDHAPSSTEIKLTPSDGAAGFGCSVSVSGDYAIVGAPYDDGGGTYSGSAYIFKRDGDVWTEQIKLTASDAYAYDYFGYSVSISGDYAIVGAHRDDDAGTDSGSAYIFKRDGDVWTEQSKLTANDAEAEDWFGYSVSISGDYAIVGASGDPNHPPRPYGAAYIFKREGMTWTQHARLLERISSNEWSFGESVSINGDYAIVCSRRYFLWESSANPVYSGVAYVFKREDTVWIRQTELTSFDKSETPRPVEDRFGNSVSVNGDYAIVGAFEDDDAGTDSGAAYIFKRDGEVWAKQSKLTSVDATPFDKFGNSVGITEDYVIVGAYRKDDGINDSGAAYIYKRSDSIWFLHAKCKGTNAGESDYFGRSVAISTDHAIVGIADGSAYVYSLENTMAFPIIIVNEPDGSDFADNRFTIRWIDIDLDDNATISIYYDTDNNGEDGTLIVAGLSEDPDGQGDTFEWDTTDISEGSYYVYGVINDGIYDPVVDYSAGVVTISHTPSYEIKLTSGALGGYGWFGGSVSISGDYAIAGACGKNAAYILRRDGSIWTEQIKLIATDAAAGDYFGYSVSVSGDYAIVGAYRNDDAGTDSGAAYIFKRDGEVWTEQTKLTASDAAAGDYFGYSVSVSGDYAIVGAHRDDDAGTDSGTAYIFKRDGDVWTEQAKLTANDASDRYFGYAVSISEGYAIVGAFCQYDVESTGSAYIFKRNDSNWNQQAKLIASDAAAYDYFGGAVSISGDYAIVGARYDDDDGSGSGSAYIFKREGPNWNEKTKITANDAVAGDYFGYSVSIIGDYIIVSARGDDDGGDASGSAYIFKHYGSGWIQEAKLTASDAAEYDYFGHSVSLNGGYAIVGAPGDDNNTSSVYIYSITTVNFSADPEAIQVGDSSTLTWSSTHADSCVIEPGIGGVDPNGSTMVSPTQTTTYTITVTGIGGTSTANVTVTVAYPPTVNISADPEAIQVGDSSTLTWSSTHADSCVIEPGIGSVDLDGSISVSPTETTTYTITATGPGGTATANVTVTVTYPLPTVSISADPETIQVGDSSTLTWSSTHADSCIVEPGIGSVDPNGSTTTSPTGTTTYTITATGPGGTATDTVTVTVLMGIITGTVTDATTSQPVADVTVNVTDSHRTQTAYTGTTGEYQIEGIRPGAITVTFTKDGYVPVEKNLSIAMDETLTLNILLYEILPGGTLIGTVTDKMTDQPLQGATVSAQDVDKTQPIQTLEDGSYTITGITPGIVEITATHTGYFPETGQLDLPAEQIYTLDLELYSESALVTVYGTMTNSTTLQPEPGVSITVEGTDISDVTLEDGTFTLENVPMGEQSLKVVKEDFCDFIQPVNINQDPFEVNLIYPLIPVSPYPAEIDTTITGYVNDAVSGQGLNGAIVRIYGTSIQATTDPDGQYTFTDLPAGVINLIAMALDHEAVLVSPTVVPGASDTFQFNLPPTTKGVITGTITNADTGEPIRHARIFVGEDSLLAIESEADGIYTLVGAPGGSYSVTAMHPEYVTAESDPIMVGDAMTTTVDFTLTHRPETGDLEGTITDKDTGDPITEAALTVQGTSITTSTDSNGYYELSDLPAGLVTIAIDADGYPSTTRTTAVVAHEDDATPTINIFDIELDALDPTPTDSISELIIAEDGGSIESADSRFMMVIPPGALSGDAIVTLMSPTDGPEVTPGDDLTLDPGLGMSDIKALGRITQIVVEPAIPGEEIPTIQGWVLISGRYFQSEVDEFNIAESSIFPYYWDGTQWTIMRVKPYEMAVDSINNLPVMVVDFSTTATGNPVTAQLGTREPIMLTSLDDHIPNLDWALKSMFVLGGVIEVAIPPQPNVKIIDKDELDAVTQNPDPKKTPNPNALPLAVIHGWDWESIFGNAMLTDPNEGLNPDGTIDISKANRYTYIVKDIVDATNGVYRPMFVTHNSRAGMVSIGNDMANKLLPSDIQGKPGEPGDDSSGRFSYLDTFSYSMGGLIARNYQVHTGGVHNMVMAGTPHHGTFSFVEYLNHLYSIGELVDAIKNGSPGTGDLLDYDDRSSVFWSANPRLQRLNQNPRCAPLGDMTLIAGTEKGSTGNIFFPPSVENDGVVPVDSVFCRTSNPDDGLKSLLEVQRSAKIYESTFEFNHFNFGGPQFRINDNPAVENTITHGFSDWVVTKLVNAQVNKYEPDLEYIEYAEFEVDVEYNVFKPNEKDLFDGRESRDIDRLALVIYSKDENGQWYASGNYVDAQGNIIYSNSIEGNSKNVEPPLTISTNALFPESDKITDLAFEVIRLKPGQETVPLEPKGNFGLPE